MIPPQGSTTNLIVSYDCEAKVESDDLSVFSVQYFPKAVGAESDYREFLLV